MNQAFNQTGRYEQPLDVMKGRMTSRQFDPGYVVPDEDYDMILEAARLRVAPTAASPHR